MILGNIRIRFRDIIKNNFYTFSPFQGHKICRISGR